MSYEGSRTLRLTSPHLTACIRHTTCVKLLTSITPLRVSLSPEFWRHPTHAVRGYVTPRLERIPQPRPAEIVPAMTYMRMRMRDVEGRRVVLDIRYVACWLSCQALTPFQCRGEARRLAWSWAVLQAFLGKVSQVRQIPVSIL